MKDLASSNIWHALSLKPCAYIRVSHNKNKRKKEKRKKKENKEKKEKKEKKENKQNTNKNNIGVGLMQPRFPKSGSMFGNHFVPAGSFILLCQYMCNRNARFDFSSLSFVFSFLLFFLSAPF
jgi:hypothetical protein